MYIDIIKLALKYEGRIPKCIDEHYVIWSYEVEYIKGVIRKQQQYIESLDMFNNLIGG